VNSFLENIQNNEFMISDENRVVESNANKVKTTEKQTHTSAEVKNDSFFSSLGGVKMV
jgi:hypothetical protein